MQKEETVKELERQAFGGLRFGSVEKEHGRDGCFVPNARVVRCGRLEAKKSNRRHTQFDGNRQIGLR